MPVRTPFNDLPAAQQAGMLCNDAQFRRFAGARTLGAGQQLTPEAAAEYLRRFCRIESCRDLATSPAARTRLATLRTEFDAWRGRIPKPR